LAIVAALGARGAGPSTGIGTGGVRLDLAQRDVLALLLAPSLAAARDGARPPTAGPRGIYRCADAAGVQRWCAIAVTDDAAWRRLVAVIAQPWAAAARFATAGQRLRCGGDIDRRLTGWTRPRPADAVVAALQAVAVPAAVVATPADLASDPQLLGRGWWRRGDGVTLEGVVPRLAG
jgi:crotonobetainyl-CoA:carnitine CoA-transferase CaiB-like acyl-CoA transferase